MDLGLKDKRVILSGGSKGIGFYTAKLLVSEGCKVAFCSRNSESLKRAEAELNSINKGSAKGIAADLESESEALKFARPALIPLNAAFVLSFASIFNTKFCAIYYLDLLIACLCSSCSNKR